MHCARRSGFCPHVFIPATAQRTSTTFCTYKLTLYVKTCCKLDSYLFIIALILNEVQINLPQLSQKQIIGPKIGA